MDNSQARVQAWTLSHPLLTRPLAVVETHSLSVERLAAAASEAKVALAAAAARLAAAERAFAAREGEIVALLAQHSALQQLLSPPLVVAALVAKAEQTEAEADQLLSMAKEHLKLSRRVASFTSNNGGGGGGANPSFSGNVATQAGNAGANASANEDGGNLEALESRLGVAKEGGEGGESHSLPQTITKYQQMRRSAHLLRAKAERVEATYQHAMQQSGSNIAHSSSNISAAHHRSSSNLGGSGGRM